MRQSLWWKITSLLIASLVFFPILTLIWLSTTADLSIWAHLYATVLDDYISSTLALMAGVAILTLIVGIGSAWLVTQYHFFGSRVLQWALLLPLAMPTYITAYSYTGLLDVAGPIQRSLRTSLNMQFGDYWFPEIRSLTGAIFVMSFVLYPYVYLLARASFLEQSRYLGDTAQLLGHSRAKAFLKINLPIARPAVVAGLTLVLMETVADYGAVSYFGVNTFTTGIFRTWQSFDSIGGATQLALLLLSFVIVLMVLEIQSRKRSRYHSKKTPDPTPGKLLRGSKQFWAFGLGSFPVVLGFVIPTGQLLYWAFKTREQLLEGSFWLLVGNTVYLASITAMITLMLALIIAYANRISHSKSVRFAKSVVGLGYAIPGAVIAIGTLIPLARLDNAVDAWFRAHLDINLGLLLTGSLAALIIAYLVRFMAVALNAVDSGLQGIALNMDQAARSLGNTPIRVLQRVHIPVLRSSLLTALLIVFVDVMKELPATLIIQPFNFKTLALRAYELASDERLADASMASMAIVLAGLIPVILLTRVITRQPQANKRPVLEPTIVTT